MASERVLILDDEPGIRNLLVRVLKGQGLETTAVATGAEATEALKKAHHDLAIIDIHLEGESGIDTLKRIRKAGLDTEVIMITAYGTVKSAVEAMKHGACDYLTKPFHVEEIRRVVARTLEHKRLVAENAYLHEELEGQLRYEGIECKSGPMREVYELVDSVAPSNASVLIQGETGTGKELIARRIHRLSRRAKGPLIVLNCAALAEGILESELFGHERGAYTGAVAQKRGRFEMADGGTLFLDEVGEIAPATQVKLLRVLQEHEFERVGGSDLIKVNVRLISATNKDLLKSVRAGAVREDLYYRLNVVHIEVPPLRNRAEDIAMLARFFLGKFCAETGKKVGEISKEAMEALLGYAWPGNVRELENIIERAVVLERTPVLSRTSLPPNLAGEPAWMAAPFPAAPREEGLDELLERTEREILARALEQHGSQSAAAKALRIGRSTLRYKLEKHKLI